MAFGDAVEEAGELVATARIAGEALVAGALDGRQCRRARLLELESSVLRPQAADVP